MCIAYYSVNYDSHVSPKSCILKVYKDSRLKFFNMFNLRRI
ncbi:Uncharacterised protein [Neisseria animaloris]|uniref:Uncharacterized protein n=1 Tax=Neisseria animaloris TaxID=326522 RepID=A0A448UEE4_9NEIS|nr:Uncharacterised protein [Neisseria animaloris]VEJ22267.1 Uncharacterised protein [Neisseria animaloris]